MGREISKDVDSVINHYH